ncbi:hypothetical protein GCM10023084_37400 [Streptomyces lacrimifluminis]|uniref:Uncharacterized protein n=1 Tax=Streptomyces lacrimifluminis TaxID=1500077 RepID=A0A917L0E8_9ACTN|nr:hypothetical protein GCM10012282_36550 [Streptomyces lacrimifluminis]
MPTGSAAENGTFQRCADGTAPSNCRQNRAKSSAPPAVTVHGPIPGRQHTARLTDINWRTVAACCCTARKRRAGPGRVGGGQCARRGTVRELLPLEIRYRQAALRGQRRHIGDGATGTR